MEEAQSAISNQTPVNANTPILSNLSMDGKAWFIHPVGISILRENKIDYCSIKFHRISKIVLRHEGGYVNNPNDSGGATNRGIAWNTWVAYAKQDLGIDPTLDNLKKLTDEQAEIIYRKRYWQPKGFCRIENDRLGLMIYDWSITSGGAIKKIQQLLVNEFNQDLNIDGKMGKATALIINSLSEQDKLLTRITEIRKEYYTNLAIKKDGTHTKNHVFLKGWLNRVDDCLTVEIEED
ncbi:glycoside hydrolase family 108 protein [Candidatus Schmidhempelia bombi]|nr:glycosyl hydrolase 108 family protein [Candidatus Schmidhempelia bombi]